MSAITSHRELIVWQKGIDLVAEVYALTEKFPRSEIYGLVSQACRAAVSIPANIAEGRNRGSRKDFRHFLLIAFGSGAELETHLEICKRLGFGKIEDYRIVENTLLEVMKMLNAMIVKLGASS